MSSYSHDREKNYDQDTEDICLYLGYKAAKDFLIREQVPEQGLTHEQIKTIIFGKYEAGPDAKQPQSPNNVKIIVYINSILSHM